MFQVLIITQALYNGGREQTMTPQELEVLRPFILPVLALIVLTAFCAVAAIVTAVYGRKTERRTWRFRAVHGILSGLSVFFWLASSAVMEYAASQLGYDAEWTMSVFVQYLIEFALLSFLVYVSVKNLRLAFKGRSLEKAAKSVND